ncbi:peptidase dimerization domain-containing protein, partial [Francisella tularensis]|uniref:peptidase dimerization domain-containing protein n=1 Tax=Francisella tularensis TaxID=263 RepID=UPI00238195C3
TPVSLAGVDLFVITLYGRCGHASTPMKANDPIIMACQFVNQVQTIVSRNANSFDPLVLSVTAIEAGAAVSVVPDQANLEG